MTKPSNLYTEQILICDSQFWLSYTQTLHQFSSQVASSTSKINCRGQMVDIIGATSQFVQLQLSFAIHFNLFPILVYS